MDHLCFGIAAAGLASTLHHSISLMLAYHPAAAGVVNAIGHDYIGVLVLGIFNAVIGRAQIPAHMQCRPMVRHNSSPSAWSINQSSQIAFGQAQIPSCSATSLCALCHSRALCRPQ